jgi:putative sterol carrier protein
MAIPFPSDEWIKAAMMELNLSPAYKEAAKTWEGDIEFVVTALPDDRKEVVLYMDLWHGSCREAYEVTDSRSNSDFTIMAPLPVWRKVLEGKLDPIRGLVSRQIKMKGNMMKVMKAPKAATELVNSCAKVDTEWPTK